MASKLPLVNYSGSIKEIASTDTIPIANGGVNISAWTSWTPTLSGISIGNGTLSCAYRQIGKSVFYRFQLVVGSTTSHTTSITFTLPITAASGNIALSPIGLMTLIDVSVPQRFAGLALLSSTTICELDVGYSNQTWDYLGNVLVGFPTTLATGDLIASSGLYEGV